MELIFRSNHQELLQADLTELHAVSKHWQSEIAFCRDEVRFLKKLMGQNGLRMVQEEGTVRHAKALMESLDEFEEKTFPALEEEISRHEKHLGVWLENPFHEQETAYREEHARLEKAVSKSLRDFKVLKKEIMVLAEHFLQEDHQTPRLSP